MSYDGHCLALIRNIPDASHILLFRLYVPTMLVVGLHGWILPPGAILFCDLFVYSEFLIHPLLLLLASKRMRKEIMKGCSTRVLVSFPVIFVKLCNAFHLNPRNEIDYHFDFSI